MRFAIPICIFLALSFLVTGCSDSPEPAEAREVVVAPVETGYFPIIGEYIGVTRASVRVEVRARVNGFIEERSFVEGGLVEAGDVLYRIDDRPFRARVNRMEAELKRARTTLEKARRDVDRMEPLYREDAVSQLDLDNTMAQLEQSEADVAAREADLLEANLELEYTTVVAPINGMISEAEVDIGALVGPGYDSLLATVMQTDPIFIEFRMSALDYLNAQRQRNTWLQRRAAEASGRSVEGFVRITLPDDSPYAYRGDIDFTDPQVNPETGTFRVRARVPNPNRQLLPGQFTRATLQLSVIPNAVIVPEEVIQIEQGGSYVMVVMPDNTVERRFVVLGPWRGGRVVISAGLDDGEIIIVEGFHTVRHGDLVRPISVQEYQARIEAASTSETPDSVEGGP